MRPPLRRRAAESGQGIVEWAVLGGVLIAAIAASSTLVGGYLAATYDQHHSSTPLSVSSAATATPEPPSVVFVDFSPVGLNEACILKAAAGSGLTWDGGELGWTAASNPRPQHSDPDYTAKLRTWRQTMTGLLTAASASPGWQACLKPELTPPAQRSQEPVETLTVDGSYAVDPASTQAIGGCGADNPTSLSVSGNGTRATVFFGSKGFPLTGTFDASSSSIQAESHDADGTNRSLHGSFSSNAGATRFTGTYDVLHDPAGCGYQFTAQRQ